MKFEKVLKVGIKENEPTKEKGPKKFDAIHLVNYEVRGEGENAYPSQAGLMSLNVVSSLLREGVSEKVVIGGVIDYKNAGKHVSKFFADALKKRLPKDILEKVEIIAEAEVLPSEEIKKGAMETGGEVDFLMKQAREHNWSSVLVVGYEPHIERIKLLYENRAGINFDELNVKEEGEGLKVTLKGSGELLEEQHPGFKSKFEKTPFKREEGGSFKKAEKKRIMFMNLFDPKGKIISFLAQHMPVKLKIMLQSE